MQKVKQQIPKIFPTQFDGKVFNIIADSSSHIRGIFRSLLIFKFLTCQGPTLLIRSKGSIPLLSATIPYWYKNRIIKYTFLQPKIRVEFLPISQHRSRFMPRYLTYKCSGII